MAAKVVSAASSKMVMGQERIRAGRMVIVDVMAGR